MTLSLPAWHAEIEAAHDADGAPSLRRLMIASLATIGIGFGGFFVWAAAAPLDSAVPAAGQVVAAAKRKTVTILESGILKRLAVSEGDRVTAGQVLLHLDETQAQALVAQLEAQYWGAVARTARLRAEQTRERTMAVPPDLEAAAVDPVVATQIATERGLLVSRWQTYDAQMAVQRKRIAQINEQVAAMAAQQQAVAARLEYVQEQLGGMRELMAKGYAPRNRVLDLQSTEAELIGDAGELSAKQAEAQQNIAQAELELTRIEGSWRADLAKELQDAQTQTADLAQKLRAARDVLKRKVVVAPEDGIVTDLKFFTPGSTVTAGQPVLDIVPDDGRMLIEVSVRPQDIENVQAGQAVNVRLTSYKHSKVPVLTGKLTYVSADRQTNERGDGFFLARAELDEDALVSLDQVALAPGMPAEVLIVGGERRALDYLISPLTDNLRRALRED